MLELILTIALIGFICWLIITYIPMPPPFSSVIMVIAAIFCILIAMRALGIGFHEPLPLR